MADKRKTEIDSHTVHRTVALRQSTSKKRSRTSEQSIVFDMLPFVQHEKVAAKRMPQSPSKETAINLFTLIAKALCIITHSTFIVCSCAETTFRIFHGRPNEICIFAHSLRPMSGTFVAPSHSPTRVGSHFAQ